MDNSHPGRANSREADCVYSKAMRAGKRTYFFDVKSTRSNQYYLTITESKKRSDDRGEPFFEKHTIFLYGEDFDQFTDVLQDVLTYIRENNTVPYFENQYHAETVGPLKEIN
mgnify:CR=1 FL=1